MYTSVALLKSKFQKQKDCDLNTYEEAYVFGQYTQWLVDQAKRQKPIQDKENYAEKIDSKSAHIQTLSNIDKIENCLFNN